MVSSKRRSQFQQDLFGSSEPESIRQRIRELDEEIAVAMRKRDFQGAKSKTGEQADLIKQLVEMGEKA